MFLETYAQMWRTGAASYFHRLFDAPSARALTARLRGRGCDGAQEARLKQFSTRIRSRARTQYRGIALP